MLREVAVATHGIAERANARGVLGYQWSPEHILRMLWTQNVRPLPLAFDNTVRDQLIKLLPQGLFATAVELGAEAVVAQQGEEMLVMQCIGELDVYVVVVQLVAACFDDVEDVVDFLARVCDRAELVTRDCAELWDEVLVCGDVEVHLELPVIALGEAQAVKIAGNVLEGSRIIVLELDGLLLAFLQHTCQFLPLSIRPYVTLTAKWPARPDSLGK